MLPGKLGLALSGGGFRASFFHIGVLARLADCDLLRHVEVISTVSGGSIVGALYYLKLKFLLEEKEDHAITADDYRQLVAELADEFISAVQQNPRMLTFVNPIKNLRMRRADYSRSDRVGELFDELFYRPVFGPGRRKPVQMRELLITPKGEPPDFHPERRNRYRAAKVPILLINATSLNTGRNWRFEAVRMGEPPPTGRVAKDLDRRMRLVRPERYDLMTPSQQDIELGHAVAASAAVPGLFNPLSISQLYVGTRVELVDGGVHDNQGIQGLLDRGCTQYVISDGSGQMEGEKHPSTMVISVLARTNAIMMSRIREEQILGADCRPTTEGLCFVHLRKGLLPEEIPYLNQDNEPVSPPHRGKKGSSGGSRHSRADHLTKYGIAPEVQEALSRIRTDLDAFNDVECYALMESGYAIAKWELMNESSIWQRRGQVRNSHWVFHQVTELMATPTDRFLHVLRTGSSTLFKVWALYPGLAGVTTAVVVGGLAVVAWKYWDFLKQPISMPAIVPSRFLATVFLLGVGLISYPPVRKFLSGVRWIRKIVETVRHPFRWLARLVARGIPSAVGSLFVYLYLKLLNPLYLRAGKVARVRGEKVERTESRGSLITRT